MQTFHYFIHTTRNVYLSPIQNNGAGVYNRHEEQWHKDWKHQQSYHPSKGIDQLKTTKPSLQVRGGCSDQKHRLICWCQCIIPWRTKA